MRVGIDLMGSECCSIKLFSAIIQYAPLLCSLNRIVVFVEKTIIDSLFLIYGDFLATSEGKKVELVSVTQSISTQEPPASIRRKKDSSIAVGIKMLANKEIDAFVSAGSTGALMMSAMLGLKRLPGIDRAALLANLPTEAGPVAVLDVGANVTCKPSHLIQFAIMGSIYQQCTLGIDSPKVGLLNIGVEAQKGTLERQAVYKALENHCEAQLSNSLSRMRFVGNIEGREVFQGDIDVLVTDGFTGNIFLKTAEGTSSFILNETYRTFSSKIPDASKHILQDLFSHLDYSEYPGAILCGVDGVVIKIHGNSGPKSLFNGIKGAFQLLESQLVQKIKAQLYRE